MADVRRAFDEGRACDAVLRYLERRAGAVRTAVRLPEREQHASPIELAFELNRQHFALEHTGIEPFPGHTQLQATAPSVIHPIIASVAGRLPAADDFELHLPLGAFAGLGRHGLAEVQQLIAAWVIRTAPTLEAAPIGRYNPNVPPSAIPGVPFRATLHRLSGLVRPGELQIRHQVRDVESLRVERLRAALEKNSPSSTDGKSRVRAPSWCWSRTISS